MASSENLYNGIFQPELRAWLQQRIISLVINGDGLGNCYRATFLYTPLSLGSSSLPLLPSSLFLSF